MQIKKSLLSVIMTFIMLAVSLQTAFADDGPDIYAAAYCVMNMNTGEIVFQKNMDEKYYPASITKIMTALVVLENCDNLDETLTFSSSAINTLSANSSTLSPMASVDEKMTVRDALYGMLLCSANECANALAEYTAGSVSRFAELMNAKAQELGAVNTHFVNPHGLHDDDHYTTSHDMALIFTAAMKNEAFAEIDSTLTYTIPATNKNEERVCTMTHRLLNGSIPCEEAYAGKTGNTVEAGRTLVTAARKYGVDLVTVIMKSDDDHFYQDTQILLEYAFGSVSGSYLGLVLTETNDIVVAAGDVRIREFPSVYAAHVYSAAAGDRYSRLATYAGWSRILVEGNGYWISTDYLLKEDGSPAADPYTTLAPTEAPSAAAVPETTEALTEAVTEAAPETAQPESAGNEIKPVQSQDEQETTAQIKKDNSSRVVSYNTQNNPFTEENLMIVILVLILLTAILAGLLVAALIVRRDD